MRRTIGLLCFVLVAAWVAGPFASPTGAAATFVVNSTGDASDALPGNSTCATAGAVCTFRAAIEEANALAGSDTIEFEIGSGAQTISPATALPIITEQVSINGTTQDGFAGTPIIELEGSSAPAGTNGLTINSTGTTVRGLVINRFARTGVNTNGVGITITGGSGNVIVGNFVGTDATATIAMSASGGYGISISADNNQIGGTAPADRNIIAGNGSVGGFVDGIIVQSFADGNVIQGNHIGTGIAGTEVLGNGNAGGGVNIQGNGTTVGGTAPGAGNLIRNNFAGAMRVQSANNVVVGNRTGGTNFSGRIWVSLGTGNTISRNLIESTGIDLGTSGGRTANDVGDADTGANGLQNFPVLTSASSGGGSTTIGGTLNSTASSAFTIEFFATSTCSPAGFSAETYLGSSVQNTDGSGNVTFNVAVPVGASGNVVATATGPSGGTSEISDCQAVVVESSIEAYIHDSAHVDITDGTIEAWLPIHAGVEVTGGGPTPTGTVDFIRYSDDACTSVWSTDDNLPLFEGSTESPAFTPTSDGDLSYRVHYDGDGNYPAGDSACMSLLVYVEGQMLIVDSTGDAVDAAPGDGNCATAGAVCTFRAAIQESNAYPGKDTIYFSIGTGLQTISPASELPYITDPVSINAKTQPYLFPSPWPLIELDGSASGPAFSGLPIVASDTSVRGLIINNFTYYGIVLWGGGGNVIRGNFIGTSADGLSAEGSGYGIALYSSENYLGGPGGVDNANVIAGNIYGDVIAYGAGNIIEGNRIGNNLSGQPITTAWGTTALGSNQTLRGNLIMGPGWDVHVHGSANAIVENALLGQIVIHEGTGNLVSENVIDPKMWAGNGIELNFERAANDTGDGDSGPNDIQNFPVLTAASTAGPSTSISGSLNSTPSTTLTLEFFSSATCSPFEQRAELYLGSASVLTNGSGDVSFTENIPVAATAGHFITATARDSADNTSPLSNCVPIGTVATLTAQVHDAAHGDATGATVLAGTALHANLTATGGGPTPAGTADWVRYDTPGCTGTPGASANDVALTGGSIETGTHTSAVGSVSYKFHYDGDGTYAAGDSACVAALVIDSAEVFDAYPPFYGCVSSPPPMAETVTITCNNPSNSTVTDDRLAASVALLPSGPRTLAVGDFVHFTATMTPSAYGAYGLMLVTDADRFITCGYGINMADAFPPFNGVGDFQYQVPLINYGTVGMNDGVLVFGAPGAGSFGTWNMRLTIQHMGGGMYNVSCKVDGATTYYLTMPVNLGSAVLEGGAVISSNTSVVDAAGNVVGGPTGPGSVVFTNPEITPGVAPSPILIDPSGYVYESADTSIRIPGASVELQRWNGSAWVVMDPLADAASMRPDLNPEFTDQAGRYRWDVAAGDYRVVVTKAGCTTFTSSPVTIPPPVTDLDIGLTCADADADGLKDWRETNTGFFGGETSLGTNPADSDTDNDGALDGAEVTNGTDPLVADMDGDGDLDGADNCVVWPNSGQENLDRNFLDTTPPLTQDDTSRANSDGSGDACDTDDDNDGLPDASEAVFPTMPGCTSATAALNPIMPDTDGDGYMDGAECAIGTNPNSSASKPTADQCRILAGAATVPTDTDGDLVQDRIEACGYGTSVSSQESDGDGREDQCEVASLNTLPAVNSQDQLLLAQAIIADLGGPFVWNADLNKDGANNSADQLLMAQIILGGGCPAS